MNIQKNMLKFVDNFLNKITMYRLILYYLIFLIAVSMVLGFFGFLSFGPLEIFFSALFILAVCWVINSIFVKTFNAPANTESVYITGLILALIITPTFSFEGLLFLFWASSLAMASKFVLAIKKKHIFNPAAVAVAITAFTINQSASWWVGNLQMLPFVLLGGILIARKIRRFDLVASFFVAALVFGSALSLFNGGDAFAILPRILLYSPIVFFAFVMLTEPLTTPPDRKLRIFYGALVGFLFAPQIHIGPVYSTPELALLLGNIFSYLASPKEKLILKLKEKIRLTADVFEFVFQSDERINFSPGQYLEWTLAHARPDSRGNRRYFTIASSPTEETLNIGVKFYPKASSFKNKLISMNEGDAIAASQRAGDFVLPKDTAKKLVFIAGGIGVTPFRSIIQYLLDKREKRQIVMFYSNKAAADIVYKSIFDKAERELGIKTLYNVVESDAEFLDPRFRKGFLDGKTIMDEVPDFRERFFYLSGPHAMVTAFEATLKQMSVKKSQIKTDYFPGFA